MSGNLAKLYLGTTAVSGNLADLRDSPAGAANRNTAASWPAAGLGVRGLVPNTTTAAADTIPAQGSLSRDRGWIMPLQIPPFGDRVIFTPAQSWEFSYNIQATGNITVTVTALAYARGGPSNADVELGRGEETNVSVTTGAITRSFGIAIPNNTPVPAGAKLLIEVYITATLNLNIGTTTVSIQTLGNSTASAYMDPGDFRVESVRTSAASGVTKPSGTAQRVGTSFRTSSGTIASPLGTSQRVLAAARRQTATATTVAGTSVPSWAFRRTSATVAVASELVQVARRVASIRRQTGSTSPVSGTVRRETSTTRFTTTLTDVEVTTTKQVTYGRAVKFRFVPAEDPIENPTKSIGGYIRTSAGNPYLGGATVILYRADTDKAVATTTSSTEDGWYEFPRDALDTQTYYVGAFVAELDGEPQQAVTEQSLVPV